MIGITTCPACGWRAGTMPYTVDLNRNAILYRDGRIRLSPVEAEVAFAIAKAWPHPMHRDRIMQLVWPGREDQGFDPFGNMVSVYASKIKKRLENTGLQIRNIHSRGYVIEEKPQ